jgi:hypothetical protein
MADSATIEGGVSFTVGSGSYVVDVGSVYCLVEFERHFKTSAQILQMEPRLEHIAWLAHSAAKTEGLEVPGDFDDFLKEVKDLEVVEGTEVQTTNPTDGGQ